MTSERLSNVDLLSVESQIGVAKNAFTCLNTKGCLRQKRLSFVGQKVAIFVGRNMLIFRE